MYRKTSNKYDIFTQQRREESTFAHGHGHLVTLAGSDRGGRQIRGRIGRAKLQPAMIAR